VTRPTLPQLGIVLAWACVLAGAFALAVLCGGCHAERTILPDGAVRESIDVLDFRKTDRVRYRGGPAPTLEADGLTSDPSPAVQAIDRLADIAKGAAVP
jgi:hypothetical protein